MTISRESEILVANIDGFASVKLESCEAARIPYPIPAAIMHNLVDYPLGTCHVYTYRL